MSTCIILLLLLLLFWSRNPTYPMLYPVEVQDTCHLICSFLMIQGTQCRILRGRRSLRAQYRSHLNCSQMRRCSRSALTKDHLNTAGMGLESGLPRSRQVLFDACQKDCDTLHMSDDDSDTLRRLTLSGTSAADWVQQAIDNEYATWHSSTFLDGGTGGRRHKRKNGKCRIGRGGTTPSAAGGPAMDLANQVPGEVKESRQQSTRHQTTCKGKCSPSRAKRRTQYANVQNLYQLNRSRCDKSILSGDWDKETPSLSIDTQEGFWRPLMETHSKVDLQTPPQGISKL